MAKVVIGIGSNLGDRMSNIHAAIAALRHNGLQISKVSRIYETEPYGHIDQPDFLNCALLGETSLAPKPLLQRLLNIERELFRRKRRRWGARTIDLDIITYDDLVLRTAELVIPHRDIANREFVLRPVCEIAPNLVHPLLGVSFCELLEVLRQRRP